MGVSARVKVRYDAHPTSLSLHDGEKLRSIMTRAVLLTLHGHVICNSWNLCRVCWEDCERKNSHVSTPPKVETTITRILKVA